MDQNKKRKLIRIDEKKLPIAAMPNMNINIISATPPMPTPPDTLLFKMNSVNLF